MLEFRKSLIAKSTATLKRMTKTATDEESRWIWVELNVRGVYKKVR